VLKQEHKLYPQAIRWFAEGRLTLTEDGRVNLNGTLQPDTTLHSPQEA
jgi:phosphoribosylglycinamide formyltransferase-1